MKSCFPAYYTRFSCIAGACPDTCCAGWDVVLDREALEKYAAMPEPFGPVLRSHIIRDGEDYIFHRGKDGRCPFLQTDGLCRMYIHAGEESLCRVCTLYPRYENRFGNYRELGLSLGCPVAAQLILEDRQHEFCTEDDLLPPTEPNTLDPGLFRSLQKLRQSCFSILDEPVSLQKKLSRLIRFTHLSRRLPGEDKLPGLLSRARKEKALSPAPVPKQWARALAAPEPMSPQFPELLRRLPDRLPALSEKDEAAADNILRYYLWHYFLLAVNDAKPQPKIHLAVLSTVLILLLKEAGPLSLPDAARLFAREMENSPESMDVLCHLAAGRTCSHRKLMRVIAAMQ